MTTAGSSSSGGAPSRNRRRVAARIGVGIAMAALVAGCASIGPGTVAVDRFDYSTAIADSWKQQTLLNIVKVRYMDLPVFVDVASVVAGYSLQTGVTVNGVLSSDRAVQGHYLGAAGQGIYTDRPTITYVPLTGEKFLRGLITPIDPKSIFSMLQTGYAADFILGLTVESLNGVRNRSTSGGMLREADPEFVRALQLIRDVQVEGPFGAWEHEHRMEAASIAEGRGSSWLEDRIAFAPPFGALGRLAAPFVRRTLDRTFAYRHAVTRDDLAQIASLEGLAAM